MQINFADKDLDRLETDAEYTAGFGRDVVQAYRRLIAYIRDATDERDFSGRRSLRYEKLKGKRQHQHSLRLNDQWRLIIEYEQTGAVKIVVVCSLEDYH